MIKYVFLKTIKNKIKEIFAYYKMKCGIWDLIINENLTNSWVTKPDKNSRVCLTCILPCASIIPKLTDTQGTQNYDSGDYKPQPSEHFYSQGFEV